MNSYSTLAWSGWELLNILMYSRCKIQVTVFCRIPSFFLMNIFQKYFLMLILILLKVPQSSHNENSWYLCLEKKSPALSSYVLLKAARIIFKTTVDSIQCTALCQLRYFEPNSYFQCYIAKCWLNYMKHKCDNKLKLIFSEDFNYIVQQLNHKLNTYSFQTKVA